MPATARKKIQRRKDAKSPVGSTHRAAMKRRARHSPAYQSEHARLRPYERIARIVITRRMVLGLSQKELAERMGTSHSVISRIESGQNRTSVETLRRIAEALETHLVLGFVDDEPPTDAHDFVAVT